MINESDVASLTHVVRRMFPDARLVPQTLPQASSLRLWLLDPVAAARRFSPEEVAAIEAEPAYWALCWPAGQVLADWMLSGRMAVAGRRVLDLGCGSGVVAIAAALAGAGDVVACDNDPDALRSTRCNAALNNVSLGILEALPEPLQRFDVIVLADVLYDPANAWLVDWACERADVVWLADSRVHRLSDPRFSRIASVAARTVPELGGGPDFSQVSVFRSGADV